MNGIEQGIVQCQRRRELEPRPTSVCIARSNTVHLHMLTDTLGEATATFWSLTDMQSWLLTRRLVSVTTKTRDQYRVQQSMNRVYGLWTRIVGEGSCLTTCSVPGESDVAAGVYLQ